MSEGWPSLAGRRWGDTLTLVVWMSRAAMPRAPRDWSSRSMAWLFWASAWAAVAARVTTPVVISAMSGGAVAAPAPDTVTVEGRRGIPYGPAIGAHADSARASVRSEERRVGKECRSRGSP